METKSYYSLLPLLKGLKFPDSYVIKFFFKEELHLRKPKKGKVIELGCGNGNNLMLFKAYGYKTIGVDIDASALENAKYNFSLLFNDNDYQFIEANYLNFKEMELIFNRPLDVLLIPNSLYYIRRNEFISLLEFLQKKIKNNLKIFLRFRSPRDSRVCCGKLLNSNEFLIEKNITGEKGRILTVYDESEMILLLKEYLNISNYKILHIYEENFHNGIKIFNADIVIWGDIKP